MIDFTKEIKASNNILFEDDEIAIILDIDPISKGHVIIVPKEPYLDIDELPEALLTKIMKAAKAYVRLLKKEYNPKGYSIMQNGGTFNDIHHFHLHVFPRFNKKEFSWVYSNEQSKESLHFDNLKEIFKEDLRNALFKKE